VPDVIVSASGSDAAQRLRVQLNPDVLPRLRVHELYARAARRQGGRRPRGARPALQEARWFIRNIQQRFDTILRVAAAIVERQRSFFTHGELAMRPLVLREIADELGLHESTISRVTTAKYMATPRGTFELKYFFGSALGTEAGGNASSTAVRALIKQFVAAEDPSKPLSDSQLAEMLKEQGIDCARRTVAKYREALKIAPPAAQAALVFATMARIVFDLPARFGFATELQIYISHVNQDGHLDNAQLLSLVSRRGCASSSRWATARATSTAPPSWSATCWRSTSPRPSMARPCACRCSQPTSTATGSTWCSA
jgi:AraC-like DNA-binding protein